MTTAPLTAPASRKLAMPRLLADTWFLTGRRLHALARQPAVIVGNLVQPAIWLFLFGSLFRRVVDIPGFGGGSYLGYLVPGVIAMNAMNASMWAGVGMIEEIDRGTLNRFLTSPVSRVALMTSGVADQAVTTALQSVAILLLGLLGGAHYPGGIGGCAVVVAAGVLLGTVFGALSNAMGMTLKQREAIIGFNVLLMLPLTFLSSAFMPSTLMPHWMRVITACNPLDWAVRAGRSALATGTDWGSVAARGGGLLALAVVCIAISVATFRSYQKSV
ncbi:ABC transporter permease [Actinomadura rupiterrae]|uniref:ABC transporter permease n=1 Tax=Actinomadura rupiterrae TaxID=559627 RepID=UPI0020A44D37|nr:ABC transporter permease [Actinomadura rupiterrae]MCP2343251.1 ABC-2 type transport system permease protein [Actinomadura rupiterrae]